MMTTFRTMDISDLGPETTKADLAEFRALCEQVALLNPEMSDEQITDAIFNNGDWISGACQLGLYELAVNAIDTFELIGNFQSRDLAYAEALKIGPGRYAGASGMLGVGHYDEEIDVTEENKVLVRNSGEHEWSEWNG